MVPMGGPGRLEEKLKAAAGPDWQRHLGSDPQRPNGSPHVLLIASSAAGANDLIKQLPSLHQVDDLPAATKFSCLKGAPHCVASGGSRCPV